MQDATGVVMVEEGKLMRRNKTTAKQDKAIEALHRSRGIAREVHFELGGTPASWLGVHTVTKNRKADNSRRACRGRVNAE